MVHLNIKERVKPNNVQWFKDAYPAESQQITILSQQLQIYNSQITEFTTENSLIMKAWYEAEGIDAKLEVFNQDPNVIMQVNYNNSNNITTTTIYDGPADQYTGTL